MLNRLLMITLDGLFYVLVQLHPERLFIWAVGMIIGGWLALKIFCHAGVYDCTAGGAATGSVIPPTSQEQRQKQHQKQSDIPFMHFPVNPHDRFERDI